MSGQLSPADVLELRHVNARYARALDLDQPELLYDVFAADMLLEFHPLDAPSMRFDGLASFLSRPPVPFQAQHFLSNQEFEACPDGARGHSYVLGQHWRAADPTVLYLIGARYEDSYRGGPGGWRIAERHCYYLWTQGNPAVLTGPAGHRPSPAQKETL